MKITLLAAKPGWHCDQLMKEARKMGIDLNRIDSVDGLNAGSIGKNFGQVVIWRSVSLKTSREVALFKELLGKDRVIINGGKKRLSGSKLYQQELIKSIRAAETIPTSHFQSRSDLKKELAKGSLILPLIKKPIVGMQGNDITLLKTSADLEKIKNQDIINYIFQPFIKNSGDFRVLVLGGKALGAIKRTGKNGSFINNISKGGRAENVIDDNILPIISDIATKVASAFNLTFCGVDIMFDDETKTYRFLEINTAPEWRGFQAQTGMNVARKILELCTEVYPQKNREALERVKKCYENNFDLLGNYRFHYATRLWLWNKDKKQKQRLSKLKKEYLNISDGGPEKKIADLLNLKADKSKRIDGFKERNAFFKKYSKLYGLQRILFFYLFAKNVYQEDLTGLIKKRISDDELLKIRDDLLKDKKAIMTLSTFAINFIYLTDCYLGRVGNHNKIDPSFLLKLAEQAHKNKQANKKKILYLLSHCIIGASLFYFKKIKKNTKAYAAMLRLMEEIIKSSYFSLNLDIKFEFLVCAGILGYKTDLKEIIFGEGACSISPLGNFLVDTLNSDSDNPLKHNMLLAEHRNVLYLMARNEWSG